MTAFPNAPLVGLPAGWLAGWLAGHLQSSSFLNHDVARQLARPTTRHVHSMAGQFQYKIAQVFGCHSLGKLYFVASLACCQASPLARLAFFMARVLSRWSKSLIRTFTVDGVCRDNNRNHEWWPFVK